MFKMQLNKEIEKWLTSMGYYRKLVTHDETCLFRAVSEQIFNNQLRHEEIRNECVKYAVRYRHQLTYLVLDWDEYLEKLQNHMVVPGYVEIQIISKIYKYDIIIFDTNNYRQVNATNNSFSKQILLCLCGEDHFDNVYRKEYIKHSGFCQSIVYNMLYENVFQMENVEFLAHKMLHPKPSDTNCVAAKVFDELLENKKDISTKMLFSTPFSYKTAKALDPNIYRNIAMDTWAELRKEWRLSSWYQGDTNFKVGTRCVLHLNDNNYHCYIQNMDKKNEPVYVYIEELAQFRYVDYNQLAPEPNAKPWFLPYRFLKNKENKNSEKVQTVAVHNKGNKKDGNNNGNNASLSKNNKEDTYNCSNFPDLTLNEISVKENEENSTALVPFVANNEIESVSCTEFDFSQDFPVAGSQLYIPPKSIDPTGRDLPQDANMVQHFYNIGIDFCKYQMNSFPRYQTIHESSTTSRCNVSRESDSFAYFSQIKTERNYFMPNLQHEIQDMYTRFDQASPYVRPGIPFLPMIPYQFIYSPFPVDNYLPLNNPQNSQILPPNYPLYNVPNQYLFSSVYSEGNR